MDAAVERALIESLEALEVGESLESVLKRYPQYAAELRPLLETAGALSKVKVAHSLAAQAESRQRFLNRAVALQTGEDKPVWTAALLFRRLTLTFVPFVMVMIILAAGVLYASAETIPGDFLYDTKRAVEDIRLSLTSDPFAQDQLRENYQEERIREIEQLLASGRQSEVSFSGIIEAVDDGEWVVAGLRMVIDESTTVEGSPMVGRFVWVEAKTINGRLIAQVITVQFVPERLPEIEPTPRINRLQTPEGLDQEAVTPTATPTATNTPSPTATAEPTATTTVLDPTDEPVIVPTETPAPTEDSSGGEDNDNDDNGNENDDDENENDDDENENDEDNENDDENENDDDKNENN